MDNFWLFMGILFATFASVAYLFALFAIITDLFRDHDMPGWGKAIWLVFLLFVPVLTGLVYLIARHKGMSARIRGDRALYTERVDESSAID